MSADRRDKLSEIDDPWPVVETGNPSISLFLSLFLLILAFFILMVSISTFEDVKSNAVMNSLTSTFATLLPRSNEPTEFTAKDGDVFAAQQFQDQVSDIFSATMQVAKVEIIQPGERMRVSIPIDSMFASGDAELRPVSISLLDRIVAALSGSPPGLRFEMEFVVGTEYQQGNALPTEQTLPLSRAGTFSREMAARGVPPGLVAVGIEPGDPRRVTLWFYIRTLENPSPVREIAPVRVPSGAVPAN